MPFKAMKIALISFGSRGDLEPIMAIGAELARRGFETRMIANADIRELPIPADLDLRCIPLNVKSLLQREGDALLNARSPVKSLKILSGIILNNLYELSHAVFEQAKDCDLILINERYYVLAQNFIDHNQAKVVQLCFQPKGETSTFPYLYYRPWFFRFFPHRLTHRFVDAMLLRKFLPAVNRMRADRLGMPPLRLWPLLQQKWKGLMLQGFSPSLFKRPQDWNKNLVVCGQWRETGKPPATLPPALQEFLARPGFTLCVGFGSMLYEEKALGQILVGLAQELNIKIVWIQNWNSGRGAKNKVQNERLFILAECDHDALFMHVDAVLHHGGSGTVHSAARHGKPQLISWFMLDQSFWAAQIESLGLGINLGAYHELNTEKLLQSLRLVVDNKSMADKCVIAAQGMAHENGVGAVMEQIFD
ncbi:MAG: glycosyltransferase family 1 protein [Saprospiraceae bacterium]|nr:glycosyltransferase family 1 protein [Saprospiraceae bacterium]